MREIISVNNSGSIQLKFSVNGKRYSFNPIKGGQFDNKRDLANAYATATKIQNDIIAGYFDSPLKKYKPQTFDVVVKPETKSDESLKLSGMLGLRL